MSFRVRLILVALGGTSFAPQAMAETAPNGSGPVMSGTSVISTPQLRAYAEVLVAVEKVRSTLATQSASLLPADRAGLQNQADAQIQQILSSNDLDRSRFNAISAQVEKRPLLQRQVHQFAMEQVEGS